MLDSFDIVEVMSFTDVVVEIIVEVVKMLIQHLVHYKLVKIIDLFKFSNTYLARPRLAKLTYSPIKQQAFIEYL